MKKLLVAAASVVLSLAPLSAMAGSEWTGYVTDSHCGKNGASKDHTANCVQKCMKDGSRAQIWNEADETAYDLDSFDKVKPLMGHKVTLTGALDADGKTIKVESAIKAEDKKAK